MKGHIAIITASILLSVFSIPGGAGIEVSTCEAQERNTAPRRGLKPPIRKRKPKRRIKKPKPTKPLGPKKGIDLTVNFQTYGNRESPTIVLRNLGASPVQQGIKLHYLFPHSQYVHTIPYDSVQMRELNGPAKATMFRASTWQHSQNGSRVEVVVDPLNRIREINEANNSAIRVPGDECKAVRDWVGRPADLRLTATKIPGRAAMKVTIRNLGGAINKNFMKLQTSYGPSYSHIFRRSALTTRHITGTSVTTLKRTNEIEFEIGLRYTPKVEYTATLYLDSVCQIAESNKENNVVTLVVNPGLEPACASAPTSACPAAPREGVCQYSQRSCADSEWSRTCAANGQHYYDRRCGEGYSCRSNLCRPNQ